MATQATAQGKYDPEILKNGATVIARRESTNKKSETDVVLALTASVQPYVTWLCDPQSAECYWGHYFYSLSEALEDFETR